MNATLSKFIDTSRWIAAACVLITHLNDRTFMVLANIPAEHRGPGLALWVFLYGFAHQAVVVFFVLSGFLVGGAVLTRAQAGSLDMRRYCLDRTIRIYLVLVPALALTTIFDMLGRYFFGASIYAEETASGHFGAWLWLGNLLSLQDIFVPYWGTNSALWTLSHEYWNYITFPLLCMPLMRDLPASTRALGFVAGLLLLITMSITGSWHLFGFFIWVAGALAILPRRALISSKWLSLAIFLIISVSCRLTFRFADLQSGYLGDLVDLAIALSFANLLLTMRFAKSGWRALNWRGHVWLSEFSYSLYAIHMPLITFLCAAAQRQFGIGWRNVPTTAAHWLLAAGILAIAFLSAWAFSRVTEAKTAFVRAWLNVILSRPTKQPPAALPHAG